MKVLTYGVAVSDKESWWIVKAEQGAYWVPSKQQDILAVVHAMTEKDRFIVHGFMERNKLVVLKILLAVKVEELYEAGQRGIWDSLFDGTYSHPTRSEYPWYFPVRKRTRGESRVPKIGYESPPGSGRRKR